MSRSFIGHTLNPLPTRNTGYVHLCHFSALGDLCKTAKTGDEKVERQKNQPEREKEREGAHVCVCFCVCVCLFIRVSGYVGWWIAGG